MTLSVYVTYNINWFLIILFFSIDFLKKFLVQMKYSNH
jgi:hypothetical protein